MKASDPCKIQVSEGVVKAFLHQGRIYIIDHGQIIVHRQVHSLLNIFAVGRKHAAFQQKNADGFTIGSLSFDRFKYHGTYSYPGCDPGYPDSSLTNAAIIN